MPSLQQLEEFRSSFKDVGDEALILADRHIFPDNIPLPDNEPPAPFPEGLGAGAPSGGEVLADILAPSPRSASGFPAEGPADFSGVPDLSDLPGMGDLGDDFGFGDLLGDMPPPPEDGPDPFESPAAEEGLPGAAGGESPGLGGDFDLPDFDMGDFNEALPGDTGPEDENTLPDLPEDLLSGFAGDIESGGLPAETGAETGPEPGSGVFEADTDFGGPEDLGLGDDSEIPPSGGEGLAPEGEGFSPEGESLDLGGDFELPGEESPGPGDDFAPPPSGGEELTPDGESFSPDGESLDLGGDFELPGEESLGLGDDFETPSFGGEGSTPDGESFSSDGESLDLGGGFETPGSGGADLSGDFSFPDLDAEAVPDFGGPGETAPEGETDLSGEDLPVPGDLTSEVFPSLGEGDDGFGSFNFPGEEPDLNAPAEEGAADIFGAENFSLEGFDDAFVSPGAGPASRKAAEESAGEVEEIQLSEEDFMRLQDTLSDYPLNLRIACEELIAEQAVAPDLMSAMVKLLVRGAPAREAALLAGKILGRTISVPRGSAKQTGADFEAEKSSFGYIFVHSFLPILRIAGVLTLAVLALSYLAYRFIYIPARADGIYKDGYERLKAGEYVRANERFLAAFEVRRVKKWFYTYAEGFRDQRQYIYAEQKYDELLRVYPRDKKGALDYASMETNYLKNYEKADRIIRTNILDWSVNDREGLIALAENNLAWGETDPSRYEEARAAYARLMEKYGRQDPFLEGMLKYFIRTDKLAQVLPLQAYFMGNQKKRRIGVPTLAELGGYLLDKRFEEVQGVPDEYTDKIEGIRDVLLRAIKEDGSYPESYYHLARYYNRYGSAQEERLTLEKAVQVFAASPEENSKRAAYRIDTHRSYAEVLIRAREFFPAEEELVKGIGLYEDALARRVLNPRREFGRLYTGLGDLEYFVKNGDMEAALNLYLEGERNGWSPPEIQYRIGAAYYQLGQWESALQRFFAVSGTMPNNKRLLYALGNVSYLRGSYYAAQSYYTRLMDILDAERVQFPSIMPGSRPEEMELAERIMTAENNLGVTLEALTRISGNTGYRGRALGLFAESIRAWDVLTRNPDTMSRMRPFRDLYGPGINLAYINVQNILRPQPDYEPQIFMRIDRDVLEPSDWEEQIPAAGGLSDNLPELPQ
ncbi:MAG: tetratricopeptide repeat protein [Treponema sp.]|jgi:hypothetical protein|nr:tetratricopeptide repeat protein [Treponema sp.]